ncbi:MAG: tetratricopeptide repeat protein, partial [Methanothrix sp.]
NVLRSLGRYDEALEFYEKVLQLDMQSPYSFHYLAESWLGKGEIFRMQGRYNESFLAYDKALELDPRYPEDVWIGRGRLLDSMGRHRESQKEYNQSFASYNKVVKNNSRRCDIWHGLGNALLGLNRYEEALKAYDNATSLNPNYAEAWFDKGLVLLALNRNAEADAAFAIARKVGYSAEPQFLRAPPVVTNVTSLGDDEFIELANNENASQGFRNLRLIADGDENKSIVLPDFTLEPGQKIRIHFGQGERNQTDLYLGSEIDLNDTAGNLTLRDSIRGIEKGYMEYWTPPAQENTAEFWLKKGNEAAGNGSFEESLQDFGKAIQIDAQNAEAWRGKGNAQKALGQNDEGNQSLVKSLTLYDEIIKANPEDTNARFNKSMVLTALGRPKDALDVLDNIIELDPKNYGALGRKAEVLSITGMYNESINTFDKALQMIPANATETLFSFWMSKGWTLLAHSDNDAALTAFEKGITLNPEDGSAWFFKGDALKALGRQSEADEAYAEARELGYNDSNPVQEQENTAKAWFKRGSELFKDQSYDEAIEAMDKVIEIDPKNETAWDVKGSSLVLLASNMYDEALTCFDKAIEIYPQDIWAWNGKGDAFNHMRRYEDAIKAYDKALEIDAQAFGPVSGKASALWKLGRHNESLKVYDDAIKLTSQDSEKALFWFDKAHLLAENGNYSETVKALEEVSWLAPQDKDLWINGGVLLSAVLSRNDEALKYYERALVIDPADSYAWYAKGEALKALGHQAEADAAFNKAKELGHLV